MHPLLERQLKKCVGRGAEFPPEWQRLLATVSEAYEHNDSDRELLEHSTELSSRELFERNQQLSEAEQKYRSIFEHATEGIFQVAPDGSMLSANPTLAHILGYDAPAQLIEEVRDVGRQIYTDPERWQELTAAMARQGTISQCESQARRREGSLLWISETTRAVRAGGDPAGAILHYEGTLLDVTRRRQGEDERKELQDRLMVLSRQAGMAEVASSVLHNVGNVLNSVNVAVNVATKRLEKSPLEHLVKTAALLKAHEADLGTYLTADAKGRQVPAFLIAIAEAFAGEQQYLLKEMGTLAKNIEHIKQVVNLQQSYARKPDMAETVSLRAVMEDALEVDAAAMDRAHIALERRYEKLPELKTDKHQVLHILLNLLSNARHSVIANGSPEKRVIVRTAIEENAGRPAAVVEVADNGVGIDPAHLTHLFTHGFTTKKDGHGFGLHASANAARQLGGTLTAMSGGAGKGACFRLVLPLERKVALP